MEIIGRAEWGARPPRSKLLIKTPTKELWLHHSASPSGYAARVRAIQNFHMDVRGWSDIAYSFLVNHDGLVYEGRGPGVSGAHTAGHNSISHAICVMGNYDTTQPTTKALNAVVELARHGYEEGWWPQYFTGGHRDASGASTSCPGTHLYSNLSAINAALEETMTPKDWTKEDWDAFQAHNWLLPITSGGYTRSMLQAVMRTEDMVRLNLNDLKELDTAELQQIAGAVADELAARLV